MSKLSAVIRHEYSTIIKQPSFWAMMIAMPVILGVIIAISYFGSQASVAKIESLSKEIQNVAVVDESGLVVPEIVVSSGQKYSSANDYGTLKTEVAEGTLNGLIHYPSDLKTNREYQIFVNGSDFTRITTITSLGDNLLKASLYVPLGSAEVISLAQNGATNVLSTYEDGEKTAGFNEYIVPGLFAVMFYLILIFSIGYILTSISEEKENRSMEMALAYLQSRTLIVGKLIGVVLVTLTQLAFFAILTTGAYFVTQALGSDALRLPAGIDLNQLVFDPVAILFGFGFLISGFMLYAGFMAITAAALPVRQANNFSSVFFLGGFSPFYFLTLILTNPENPVVQFTTFFPLTSPTVTLIRNTIGNMGVLESSLALAFMTLCTFGSVWLAVKIFPKGALEFQNRLSFKSFFK